MRFHHFEGHDDDGLFIDLDHVRTICEDGTREGYAIVHTDRTAFLVKGDYREIAKLVMAKAPEAQADPAAKFQDKALTSTTYRWAEGESDGLY